MSTESTTIKTDEARDDTWTLKNVAIVSVIAVTSACETSTQKVEPAGRGARGETCQARNDCQSGLACIAGTCSKNDFGIKVSAKQCDRIDCEEDKDCCGSKPLEAPEECANRERICTPSVLGCTAGVSCADDGDCNGGNCVTSTTCSVSFLTCTSNANCRSADVCDTATSTCTLSGNYCTDDSTCWSNDTCNSTDGSYSYCSLSGLYCTDDSQCYAGDVCGSICDCTNPDYDAADPICSDPDCFDFCELRCEEERCVVDTTCEEDTDCVGLEVCDKNRCVECTADEDCDEDEDELCVNGNCERGCEAVSRMRGW